MDVCDRPDAVGAPALPARLRKRHLAMIALGGAIGAGLFIGSGAGIQVAGPGIVVSYLAAGVLTMLVMRMLGEMAAARPATGSFAVYAAEGLGSWAGLVIGWLYWSLLVVSVAAEAIGAAHIMAGYAPGVPGWAWVAVFVAVFTGTNLAGVRNFGELEFWFAGLKIAAICAFLALGAAAIAGVLPGAAVTPGANLLGHGGLLPHGWHGVALGMVAAVFAFGGLETVTIAAAECADPVPAVRAAVRAVTWRIAVFYLGSMAVIVTVVPWAAPGVATSPYATAAARLGIPAAAHVMNVVVLIALLSAMNANIYGSSRMMYALVDRGDAPRLLGRTKSGSPRNAVLASSAFGFLSVALSMRWPNTVFLILLNCIGAAILVIWILIAATQLRLRGRLERQAAEGLPVRMWGYPYLTAMALVIMAALLIFMLFDPSSRIQLAYTAGWTAVLIGSAWLKRRVSSVSNSEPETDPLRT